MNNNSAHIIKFLAVSLSSLLLSGCLFNYVVKSAYNQAKILNNRVPISQALKDPELSSERKSKLQLALEARIFAEKHLNLKPSNNYSSYVDLGRPYVSFVLRAAPAHELKSHLWSFPIVGKLPYKGYFTRQEAKEAAKEFTAKDYDTYIRGVTAYSTLGWFDDPLLSSMLSYSDYDLVNVIIHETVHATLFIEGQADFNERLATFLGNKGSELFYLQKEGPQSPTLKVVRKENLDDSLFSQFISKELDDLKKWYADNKGHISSKDKSQRLKQIQSNFSTAVQPKLETKKYLGFTSLELNNALLLSYQTYMYDLSDFEALLKQLDNDFSAFLQACRKFEKAEDPEASLKKAIKKQTGPQ